MCGEREGGVGIFVDAMAGLGLVRAEFVLV